MHTGRSPGRLIPFLSTPNRVLQAARRTAETILPCTSDTNSTPQEPLRSLFAKADASAAIADSTPPRRTAPTKALSPSPRRSAEVRPTGCLSQHRRNGVFHTCGPVSSTRVENSTELSTSCGKDSPASPMGIFSRIGVSGSGVSRLERDRPPPLVADSLALLSPTSRHQLPPLCPPPPVISRLRPFVFRLRSPPASRHAHAVFVVVSGRRGHDLLAVDLDRVLLSLDDVG